MMDQFGAARGLLLLKREQYPIDSDYRLFAHSPGVTLILGARGRVSIFSRSPVARRYLAARHGARRCLRWLGRQRSWPMPPWGGTRGA
jgi:hypothetical protein